MGRKAFIVMLALALVLGLSLAAMAQEAKKAGKHGDKAPGHLPPGLDELGLTDEQKAKVQQAAADMQAKMKELKASGAAEEEAKKKQMEIRKAFEEQLNTILTDEQKKKRAEQMKAKGKAGGEKKEQK